MKRAVCLSILVVAWCRAAGAQPAPGPTTPAPVAPAPVAPAPVAPAAPAAPAPPAVPATVEAAPVPATVDATTCMNVDTTPGALLEPAPAPGGVPIPWDQFEIDGKFIGRDTAAVVHGLFDPTMQGLRTTLTPDKWAELAALAARFGYQLVGHAVVGTRLELHVQPLPAIRKVAIHMSQGFTDKLLDDEVRHRMLLRAGTYLPWGPTQRACASYEERQRLLQFLYDEGYFDAKVQITTSTDGPGARIDVRVNLGPAYTFGTVRIIRPTTDRGDVPDAAIRAKFERDCPLGMCIGKHWFTRAEMQRDVQKVKDLFHKKEFPAARIIASDPRYTLERRTHVVNPTLTIDQRRGLDVVFAGSDRTVGEEALRRQLTFDKAGSADDVEAAASAHAIQDFLQQHGYFDAHVTWRRDRFPQFDRITFDVEQGPSRQVRAVDFVGAHAIPGRKLAGVVATKAAEFTGQLFGTNTAATSTRLAEDVERIVEAYRQAGYREARVRVSASPRRDGLDDPALTAALLATHPGHDLYVRFTIDEGEPTLLTRVVVDHADAGKKLDDATCAAILRELASEIGQARLARRADPQRCIGVAANLVYREDDVALTHDRLRDFLYKTGRPRAIVDYEPVFIGPRRVEAHYRVRNYGQVRIGQIVIRGNFRTRSSIIRDQLRFHTGDLLTTDTLANAARRLRSMGLFDAVNIDLPDLASGSDTASAVVRVEERYDYLAQVALEFGYSSVNQLFAKVTWGMENLFGSGLGLSVSGTKGQKITELESNLRIPTWLSARGVRALRLPRWLAFQTDVTGSYLKQDTPRFGWLTTEGADLTLSWIRQQPRTPGHPAHTHSFGLRYDFRLRSRNIDAVRPSGIDMDDSQVAISTRTGSVGAVLDLDHRVDRDGQAAPLAPEAGWRLNLAGSFASPVLLGQDTFFKISADGSMYFPIGDNLVVRTDLRYDQGFPLGGAVLLPEVERFFAGGDSTVRGYADDRLATEVVKVGVPPLGNLSQIRIIPAGGDIRVLGSVDAQVRIWKIFAGALFSDAGLITNEWSSVTVDDIRPSVGMGLRAITPFGIGALEYAIPLNPKLGDDPRGRIHFYFAARAQF